MLHTKFQGHWCSGSGEEDFLRFLRYMGMAAMLVMLPRPFEQFFIPKGPQGNRSSGFLEKKIFLRFLPYMGMAVMLVM